MAILSRPSLITDIVNNIYTNLSNLISGDIVKTRLENIADSHYNRVTDKTLVNLRPYDSGGRVYEQGECCTRNKGIYQCIVPTTTGNFNIADWELISSTAGSNWKDWVRVATTTDITLSGTQTIDTVATAIDDSVLVKNQIDARLNGIYLVKSGAWVRRNDLTTGIQAKQAIIPVSEGTDNADTNWIVVNDGTITIGSTYLTIQALTSIIPDADAFVRGKAKLYADLLASNTDGSVTQAAIAAAIATKQNTLISGTNIKTINNQSILGSGNITVEVDDTMMQLYAQQNFI